MKQQSVYGHQSTAVPKQGVQFSARWMAWMRSVFFILPGVMPSFLAFFWICGIVMLFCFFVFTGDILLLLLIF